MRTIILDLKSFVKEHFNLKLYLLFFLINVVFIVFNYSLDFEDSYIDEFKYSVSHIFLLAAYLAVGYYLMVLIQELLFKRTKVLCKVEFWIKSLVALIAVGLDRAFYFHRDLYFVMPHEAFTFTYKSINNLIGVITVMLPFFLVYLLYDRRENLGFYGVRKKQVNLKPFFSLFIVVVPLVLLSAIFSEMGTYYPMYQWSHASTFIEATGLSEYLVVFLYEIGYAFDFFNVELVFRGLLIIGMIKLMGKEAILPMVTAYSILHFGKPLPETISSIFGGYILAVFAYKYKHIWAGVILHIGLAWLMELFGWMF